MFSEILKITPKLDNKDLQNMQRTLQSRFTKIAKGFGKGLVGVLKGGGIAGIALGLIDKILNPLKEVQDSIDRMLKSSDDLATNAGQFNTSTGKLFKLVQLAKSSGLDEANLFQLITKFQTAVAQAKADPNDQSVSSVRNFVGQTDTAEGFFNFIKSLQSMEKNQQVLVQQQVFGEKQILRMSDFLQLDFVKQFKEIGLDKVNSEKFTKSIEGMARLNDLTDALTVRRENEDVLKKGGIINESMVRAKDKSERLALEKENKRIQSYENLATISDTTEKIFKTMETGMNLLGMFIAKVTPIFNKIDDAINKLLKSPMVRGVKSWFGGKDD